MNSPHHANMPEEVKQQQRERVLDEGRAKNHPYRNRIWKRSLPPGDLSWIRMPLAFAFARSGNFLSSYAESRRRRHLLPPHTPTPARCR